jgi:hypothetical protein
VVYGLEMFQKSFEKYSDQYVLIGGTACSILMDEIGAPFRVTKDLDVVLILNSWTCGFTKAIWKFIEEGGYEHAIKTVERNQAKSCQDDFLLGSYNKARIHFARDFLPHCGRPSTCRKYIK